MQRITVEGLPDDPLAAAGMFHRDWAEPIESALSRGKGLIISIAPADHTHREWRRAAVAMLARRHTPLKINMVAGEGNHAGALFDYLVSAPGVTGQYFEAAA